MDDRANNVPDTREGEVADMARRAALAASEKRRLARIGGDGPTADDVDAEMMARLSTALEDIATWIPGFGGAMLFRGESAQPLVSLIESGEREAMRRLLTHVAAGSRQSLDLIERDVLGPFRDSIISTENGAALVVRLGDDLLVVAVEGRPARIGEAWVSISKQRDEIEAAAAGLIRQ